MEKSLRKNKQDTNGESVDSILYIYKGVEFSIYEGVDGIWWTTDNKEISARFSEFSPKTSDLDNLARQDRTLKRAAHLEIARAYQLCGQGKTDLAIEHIAKATARLQRLKSITGKFQYLLSCLITVLIIVLLTVTITLISTDSELRTLAYVASSGSLGAFLSVALNLNKLEIDYDSPWFLNAISGASRIFIGVFGAIFTYFLIKADIILGVISSNNSTYAIFAASIVAGFSETLVPNMLRKAESP